MINWISSIHRLKMFRFNSDASSIFIYCYISPTNSQARKFGGRWRGRDMAYLDVRRILFDMLPSPAIVEQGRARGLAHHLESIRLHLWAINAAAMDAELRGQEDWMATVGATMVDLEVLLTRIADWHETASDRWTSGGPFFGLCASFRLACKLTKMVRRLRGLVLGASALNLRKDTMQSMDPLVEDYSDILEEEVLGRDGDREEIVKRIQQPKPNEEDKFGDAPPCVIVIYGPSGMGKTTLARMVYHHDWVRRCFRHRVWVDVSNLVSFDMVSVATEIARSVAGAGPCMKLQPHPQSILEFVLGALAGDRYLLVLDGIDIKGEAADFETYQSKLTQKWDQMTLQIFSVGAPGSTIIVTVADQYQAEIFKSATTHNLTALSENDWLVLFKKHAIKNRPDQDEERAAAAAAEDTLLPFLKGCYEDYSGSPLEAKLLGSVFRYTEVKRWRREIVDLGLLNRRVRENQHYSMASFHHLPTRSARLQLYCSLFPEWKRATPLEDFMHMMLVEGLVPDSGDRDEAIWYLKNNVVAAFHQRLTRSQHYFTLEVGQGYSSRIPKQCRHLCLLIDSNTSISATALQGVTKLRTLILRTTKNMQQKHQKYQFAELPEAIFVQLAYLRILHLADSKIQTLPRAIEKLSDLRYLNLSNSEIEELPGSLCSLRNLQVLKLAHCKMLLGLPGEIHKLQKLRILKLAHCEKLQKLPDSVTSLVNLQELNVKGCCFLVELPEDFSGMQNLTELNMQECASLTRVPRGIEQLSELRSLLGYPLVHPIGTWIHFTRLKQLWLEKLEHDMSMQNIVRTKLLQQITNLENLALHWQWSERSDASNNDIQVDSLILLDHLEPRDCLKKLEIFSYFGVAYPKWMDPGRTSSLNNLVEIRLMNLKACRSLPPLGHLPRLQIAVISGMEMVVTVADSFYAGGSFLRLRKLTFSEMPSLRIWNPPGSENNGKEENEEYFPLLEELTLFQCPKLKELNVFIRAWRLKMSLSNGLLLASQIQKSWDNLEHLEELEIVGCQELERLPAAMANLKYLRKLTIIWCNNLVALPNWLLGLSYLSRLQVSDCPNLSWIPQGLKKQQPGIAISVHDCPNLQWY